MRFDEIKEKLSFSEGKFRLEPKRLIEDNQFIIIELNLIYHDKYSETVTNLVTVKIEKEKKKLITMMLNSPVRYVVKDAFRLLLKLHDAVSQLLSKRGE